MGISQAQPFVLKTRPPPRITTVLRYSRFQVFALDPLGGYFVAHFVREDLCGILWFEDVFVHNCLYRDHSVVYGKFRNLIVKRFNFTRTHKNFLAHILPHLPPSEHFLAIQPLTHTPGLPRRYILLRPGFCHMVVEGITFFSEAGDGRGGSYGFCSGAGDRKVFWYLPVAFRTGHIDHLPRIDFGTATAALHRPLLRILHRPVRLLMRNSGVKAAWLGTHNTI